MAVLLALGLGTAACSGSGVTSGNAPSSSAAAGQPSRDPTDTGRSPSTTTPAGVPTTPAGEGPPVSALPPGPVTIVALGDSLTEGAGDDDGIGYVGRLPDLLARRGRPGSNVVNLGHSGWDSQTLIDGQDDTPSELTDARAAIADARAAGRPVIALVLIGSNDLWYLYEYGPDGDTPASDETEDVERYRRNLQTIVSRLRADGAAVVLAINDDQSRRPVAADDAIRSATFPSITRREVGSMSAQARRYAAVVREVADANGALIADFLESPVFISRTTMSEDGNHPNAAGYDQLAADWTAAMAPLLR